MYQRQHWPTFIASCGGYINNSVFAEYDLHDDNCSLFLVNYKCDGFPPYVRTEKIQLVFFLTGNYNTTSSFSARIIVIFTLILSLLIYQFYSGGIMSFLLMKPSTTIRTISDIDNSGMNVGLEDIIYIRDFFKV